MFNPYKRNPVLLASAAGGMVSLAGDAAWCFSPGRRCQERRAPPDPLKCHPTWPHAGAGTTMVSWVTAWPRQPLPQLTLCPRHWPAAQRTSLSRRVMATPALSGLTTACSAGAATTTASSAMARSRGGRYPRLCIMMASGLWSELATRILVVSETSVLLAGWGVLCYILSCWLRCFIHTQNQCQTIP